MQLGLQTRGGVYGTFGIQFAAHKRSSAGVSLECNIAVGELSLKNEQ